MKPFMPYMGGKRKMLPYLRPNLPTTFKNFHEPFLGGGALALDVMERCLRDGDTDHTFFLSDYSADVVAAWTAVKDHPQELEETLRALFRNNSREHFMHVRNWDREGLMDSARVVTRGARFIYLMKTCFGGLIKTGKDGFLSMAFGDRKNMVNAMSTYDYKHMHSVSGLLNSLDVRISQASYEVVLDNSGYGDFIYLDPPYETHDDSGKKLCSDYVSDGIDHGTVKQVVLDATSAGAYVLLSNSNTSVTRELFDGWAQFRPSYYWAGGGGSTEAAELMVANWRLADHIHRQQALAA